MDLKKIGIVISHEYSIRVRKKSFILTTILTPLLLGLLIFVPAGIMLMGGEDAQKVKIIDESGLIASYFESNDKIEYVMAEPGETLESVRDNFFDTDLYAVVGISELDAKGEVSVTSFSSEPLSVEVRQSISRTVNKVIETRKLKGYNIDNLDQIMDDVKTDIKLPQ